jgi:PIN domain nuclease of toxin-antitoxin system
VKVLTDTHTLVWACCSGGFARFHKDPFDRILVTQALSEGLMLASKVSFR